MCLLAKYWLLPEFCMQGAAMANKWILNMADMEEDFFSDALFIGIASPYPAYRFCWLLNQHFDVDFRRNADIDLSVQTPKNGKIYFPVYQYAAPLNGAENILYRLKNQRQSLLSEIKGLDFLWMIRNACQQGFVEETTRLLRTMPQVQLAQILAPKQLKNRNYLLF
jgi:hypothetical protein